MASGHRQITGGPRKLSAQIEKVAWLPPSLAERRLRIQKQESRQYSSAGEAMFKTCLDVKAQKISLIRHQF
jgi:hypothetical protein